MIDNKKKEILDDIFNELVKISVIEYPEMKDKRTIDTRYSNHQTVNAITKKCSALCLRDYDFSILRDQVYESVYSTMLKISKDFNEQQLIDILGDIHTKNLPETNSFLVSVYKLGIFSTKMALSGSRRSSQGMILVPDAVEYTEEVLNRECNIIVDNNVDVDADISFFLQWYHEHKDSILTKKQLQYINDPSTINDKNKSSMQKRIYKNVLAAFEKEFDSKDDKVNQLNSQIRTIEKILDAKDFVKTYTKFRDKSYIVDAITSFVSMPTMKAFNTGNYTKEVIKEYRVALFKKLNNLNILLEQAKNEGSDEGVLM